MEGFLKFYVKFRTLDMLNHNKG